MLAPVMTTFLKSVGTPLYGTTMSSTPSLANPGSSFPVLALSAIMLLPEVNRMRGGFCLSPGQYATPRVDTGSLGDSQRQISLPFSGSSATTRLSAGTYITPLTTMGMASEAMAFGSAAPLALALALACSALGAPWPRRL